MTSANIRVFIAEDQGVIRQALKTFIASEPNFEVVGEASSGLDVVAGVQECNPDVIVMDLALPGMDGIQCTAQLLKLDPDIKVIALTAYEDIESIRETLKAGARGYVLKSSMAHELTWALNVVARGGTYLDPVASTGLHALLSSSSPTATSSNKLSEREMQVVTLIAKGFSSKQIAEQLKIGSKTVETYKARCGKTGCEVQSGTDSACH